MITGATGGLGTALAVEAARQGYRLLLTDLREEGAEFAQSLALKYGIDVQYLACDLSSMLARTALFDRLRAEGSLFWALLNVAGLDYEGAFLERKREQMLRMLHINMEATLDVTHTILGLRAPGRTFRLLNVCSFAAFYPIPFKAVYGATKRFLLDFSRALHEELRGSATVLALCPAGLPTTAESIRRMAAQGFWGKITMMDTQLVARETFSRLLRGARTYVPGFINRVLRVLGSVVPEAWLVRLVARRWGAVQPELDTWTRSQTK
ncbi:MAG: SDR family NAD(P)-dependent oxidoreductase [Anaerolineae bacterium]